MAAQVGCDVLCFYVTGFTSEPILEPFNLLGSFGYLRRSWEGLDASHRAYFVQLLEEEAADELRNGHAHRGWSNRAAEAKAIIAAYRSGDKCQAQPVGELHFTDALDAMSSD